MFCFQSNLNQYETLLEKHGKDKRKDANDLSQHGSVESFKFWTWLTLAQADPVRQKTLLKKFVSQLGMAR